MKRRVVVTGMGTINAVGHNLSETWNALIEGKSGIDTITRFDPEGFASRIAGEIKGYDSKDYFPPKEARKMDPYTQYAIVAAREAFKDSGLVESGFDPERAGVIMGAGIGGMETFEQEANTMFKKGPRRLSPFFIPKMISNIAAAYIAIEYQLKAINFNCVTACASANHALGTAFRSIQYGDADIILSGGAEAAVTPLAVGGFCAMKALSTRNDEPQRASRPFDQDRDGFIMAEGAGLLILEELEHAKRRGARIYAEVIGYGATCDAFHITAPAENGEGGARACSLALKDAGIQPEEVEYFNAHGTSTLLNDINETEGIKTVFKDYAYKLKISSTKSMVGHTLGAAAGIEGIACCKSIETGILHPTVNLENPDPKCDLDYIPGKAIEYPVRTAVCNSLGFGGHNAVVIYRKLD